ncbi:ABC transporter substrate-binding protein [Actinosynnema sp. NPDC047251]|uniref:ABC-type transporter, substrate-binding lipoprotein, family 5 n=1 Tax=Saccharothrix espanaensis (strain ATCC 51144 / DSM 44229 / JCM 9112 / NBRC 15066 / NRRL 15764) TaxID=1179773 RepID=K0K310_SACES|nr:ABC transporter substrate-binding protein [Saccharothrix espanaensis]CCH31269.1 ABC-type transporter, substrate-binding lipoprotein, family 5 [Saccharothrix espanaensis DSM 44229]
MTRSRLAVAAALAGALAVTACGANEQPQGAGQAAATRGGTLRVLSEGQTVNFDPAKSASLAVTSLALVHRRLTAWHNKPGEQAKVVPDLADVGKTEDGGKTWTFTLQEGLKFSDGTPITSADVKWGVERSFAPSVSGGLGYHKQLIDGGADYRGPFEGAELKGVETPDARTIRFRLVRPYGDWPWVVSTPAFAPVPKGKGAEPDYAEHPVASGPYQLAKYQKGVEAKLTRNPHWDEKTDQVRAGLPDEVVFQLGQDASVVSQRLTADSGDDKSAFGSSFVSAAQLAQLSGNASAKQRVVTSKSGALAYLALNTEKAPLDNPKVREAFQYAVDKTSFQIASAGNAQLAGDVATTLITEGIPGRERFDLFPAPPAGDPEKAKKLLAEAGFPNGLQNLDFLVAKTNNAPEKAQALQASLARAGIQTTIRTLDGDAYTEETSVAPTAKFDLTLASWQPDFPSANANIQPLFASSEIGGGGYNLSRYRNPEVDKLIDAAQATVDPAEAGTKWAAIDKLVLQDSPIVPLIYTRNSFLRGSKVTNLFIADFPAYPNYLQVGLTS